MTRLSALITLVVLAGCGETSPGRPATQDAVRENPEASTPAVLFSQIHRRHGGSQLTTIQESQRARSLPADVEEIPLVAESDDGRGNSPVTRMVRPTVNCGLGAAFTTLQARLNDCAQKNAGGSTWRGNINGNAGEGDWLLVARMGTQEAWLDRLTGFIWGPKTASTVNWCKAAGNVEGVVDGGTVDCAALGAATSVCAGAEFFDIPSTRIAWRLPTRGDFLQADINGARFVLPEINASYWSATVNGANRDQAWSVQADTGVLISAGRDQLLSVRCLGRALP